LPVAGPSVQILRIIQFPKFGGMQIFAKYSQCTRKYHSPYKNQSTHDIPGNRTRGYLGGAWRHCTTMQTTLPHMGTNNARQQGIIFRNLGFLQLCKYQTFAQNFIQSNSIGRYTRDFPINSWDPMNNSRNARIGTIKKVQSRTTQYDNLRTQRIEPRTIEWRARTNAPSTSEPTRRTRYGHGYLEIVTAYIRKVFFSYAVVKYLDCNPKSSQPSPTPPMPCHASSAVL
jgi:hypothetical protein